ncbi:MAG: viroplasmin family protein [Alloprevotella sp.]
MAKRKFYVVWYGVEPGIYESWADCQAQTKNFKGAVYKSFDTREEAEEAYYSSPSLYVKPRTATKSKDKASSTLVAPPDNRHDTVLPLPAEVAAEALAVDAACSGNPGPMEYRGVYLKTGQEVFHFGPVYGTNNIGEFLAIVHGLALLHSHNRPFTIYSDSRNAMLWVKNKKCKTALPHNAKTAALFELIARAEKWLNTHDWSHIKLLKWQTKTWGEVPADFGRKG